MKFYTPKSKTKSILTAIVGLCLTLTVPAAKAQVIIADSTFNNSDWSAVSIPVSPAPAATVSFNQVATGGDPGAFQQVSISETTPGSDSTYRAEAAVIDTAQSYTPSTQGAALSITFSGDFQQGGSGSNFLGFFAEQNGLLYRDTSTALLTLPTTWTPVSDTVSELQNVEPGGPLDLTSDSTSPIYFGIGLGEASGSAIVSNYDLDNFSVTIDTVATPEPSSWALGLIAIATMVYFRRRTLRA